MNIPNPNVVAFSIDDAVRASGIGRSTLYKAISSGALPARKSGSRTVILRTDLAHWVDGLPAYNAATKYPTPANLTA